MRKTRTIQALTLSIAMLVAMLASAHAAAITIVQARAVVDQIMNLVAKDYVFPERRAAIVARLRASKAAGRYDLTDPGYFADAVQQDMFAASNDKHMWLKFNPEQSAALEGQPETDRITPYEREMAARRHQGYEAMRILPGNVRYLNMAQFYWNGTVTTEAAAAAARFLGGGDAIIIDIRDNPGGYFEAVQALVSYFLPPKDQLLMTFHDDLNGKITTTSVLKKLAAPRLTGKPLYVLISERTGSAAEEFAYHVKAFKLGTLVGRTTAGAGNNDTLFPLAPGFVLSVSTGRPVHAVTGTNWDGVGVLPDVDVPADGALDEANVLALRELAKNGPKNFRDADSWAINFAEGRAHPLHLDAAALAPYEGQYGHRKIWLENGVLHCQREGEDKYDLLPLIPDVFAYAGTDQVQIRFVRTGDKISGLDITTDDGQHVHADRSP